LFLLNKVSGAGKNFTQNPTAPANVEDVGQSKQETMLNLSEQISSKVYPLESRWFAQKLFFAIVTPFIYWAIFIFLIMGSKNGEILQLKGYYSIDKKGAGQKPTPGDSVSVNYTGKLLDGTPFDSNTDPLFKHMQPLRLMVGIGQVIPGWDEGLLLLPEGSKGRFFIPSGLAYQNQQAGPLIKPFSILIFDVELLDVKKLHLKK
jgi:hypothetical protein